MRTPVLSVLAVTIALGAALPAAAQTAAPFTGLRLEGLLGYDNANDGGGQDASSGDGLLFGAAVGYDMAMGPVVVGVEGELTDSSADTRSNSVLLVGDRLDTNMARDLYAGARVGYAISPVALGYVKAGYSNARIKSRYDAGAGELRSSDNLDGLRLGAGLEYALGINSFVKGEYRYTNYARVDGYDRDFERHQLVAGLGFRF